MTNDERFAQLNAATARLAELEARSNEYEDGFRDEWTDADIAELDAADETAGRLYREWMLAQGWTVEGTGGGCEAWRKDVDNGYALMTEQDDPSLPSYVTSPVSLGLYVSGRDGEDDTGVACFTCAGTVPALAIVACVVHVGEY